MVDGGVVSSEFTNKDSIKDMMGHFHLTLWNPLCHMCMIDVDCCWA